MRRSIWRVRSRSPRSTLSPVVPSTLKRAVYVLPVNQHLPKTPFSPHCYSPSSLPLLSICFPAAFYAWCQAPHPLRLLPPPKQPPDGCFCQWDSRVECRQSAIHSAFKGPNMCITLPNLLSHFVFVQFFLFVFFTYIKMFHFLFVFGVEQVKNKSYRCLTRHALLQKRVLVGGYLATCVKRQRWGKKEKTRGHSFKFVFPSLHRQKRNLSMNSRVYS